MSIVMNKKNFIGDCRIKRLGVICFFFFFQAEDGIRDLTVTGVQTCALPIYAMREGIDATRPNGQCENPVASVRMQDQNPVESPTDELLPGLDQSRHPFGP